MGSLVLYTGKVIKSYNKCADKDDGLIAYVKSLQSAN